MITIEAKLNDKTLKQVIERLSKIKQLIRRDARALGRATIRYTVGIVPRSAINKPHLRDSFHLKTKSYYHGVKLVIYSTAVYALALDTGANVPPRQARKGKAMRFIGKEGYPIYRARVKGFRTKGIHYISKVEHFALNNAGLYIDLSMKRYLQSII